MEINDMLGSTPTFNERVYRDLPDFLKTYISQFNEPREKDLILISSLVVLSGCFSSLKGMYDRKWVYPNLFCFVVAPPASGKGIMKFSSLLGKHIHDEYVKTHQSIKSEYKIKKRIWERESIRDLTLPEPPAPMLPVLYIPGNSSTAAMYGRLRDSNASGIIFETEADRVTEALKQDWGGFSDLFRNSFHHETLSSDRIKNERELINIENPRLSILLSGTPNQVPKLITSSEDGLFSRFLFYCFAKPVQWKNVAPNENDIDLSDLFSVGGFQIQTTKQLLDRKEYSFKLTDAQFKYLDIYFKKKVGEIVFENEKGSTVLRLGLIAFRICMVLTVLRNMKKLDEVRVLVCEMKDFITAFWMVDAFMKHANIMHELLPGKSSNVSAIKEFYNKLPVEHKFPRADANKIGEAMGFGKKTVYNYLQKLKDNNMLSDAGYGFYIKHKPK